MLPISYNSVLVIISVVVAILASYTALNLADRVRHSTTATAARWWIIGGGLAMGIGIWSMHFIGMLAVRLPIPIGYDLARTLFSLTLPVLVSALSLWQASFTSLAPKRLVTGACLMGIGIAAMHYSGMAAMRMQPGIVYEPVLVLLSIVIAILASGAALWIAFALQRRSRHTGWLRAAASMVMGLAIVGMHYTGMAAARFPADAICFAAMDGVNTEGLAILVIVITGAVLAVALLITIFDARLALSAAGLASSQAIAAEREVLLTDERSAREEAERTNVLKDEFLATLSHELRTPLSAILGWSQILRGKTSDQVTLIKGLETIERNARAQSRLIDDLMDMNKIVSGKISLDVQLINPVTCVEAALDTIRPAAFAKQIQLETQLPNGVALVSGDANRLQQIMWNLLSNAVKFTPRQGKVSIVLTLTTQEIRIAVSDSGIGIETAFLPFVFDRFRQADASTTRRYGGLGLGLAIVKQLVELHGGWIRAESAGADKGATFVFGLPRDESAEVQTENRFISPAIHEIRRSAFKAVDLTGLTVLVVDDEPDALEVVKHLVRDCGARTLTAANAIDGLSLIQKELPDVLVSDIGMPNVDGHEFIRRLRGLNNLRCNGIPAIALTAFTRHEDKSRAIAAGFTAFMTKPVEPSELVQKILEIVVQEKTA